MCYATPAVPLPSRFAKSASICFSLQPQREHAARAEAIRSISTYAHKFPNNSDRMSDQGLHVVWLKRDLRIADHAPLLEACKPVGPPARNSCALLGFLHRTLIE